MPKEKLPDIGLVALLVARRLRRLNAKLVEKSDAYDRELDDDAEPRERRERRDTAAAALTSEVLEIREVREAQAASEGKARAMAANDDELGRSASLLSALFRALRDNALAAKVRPSAKRPGRVLDEEESAPEEEAGEDSPTEGQNGG